MSTVSMSKDVYDVFVYVYVHVHMSLSVLRYKYGTLGFSGRALYLSYETKSSKG